MRRIFNERNLVGALYVVFAAPFLLVPLLVAGYIPMMVEFVLFTLLCLLFGVRGFLFLLPSRRLAAFELRHSGIRFAVGGPWQFNPLGVAEPIMRRRAAIWQVISGLLMIFIVVVVIVQLASK